MKANEAAIVSLRMTNYTELSDNNQVCIVLNPNSQSAAILVRSFSITTSGLCVSVFFNTHEIHNSEGEETGTRTTCEN